MSICDVQFSMITFTNSQKNIKSVVIKDKTTNQKIRHFRNRGVGFLGNSILCLLEPLKFDTDKKKLLVSIKKGGQFRSSSVLKQFCL